ncbi:hypothetical protein K443DRAFT_14966 [Laccaria amethystina LaAM-08-1]|uniref:Uncharacterized protein n=1 Tax=Laccaria amethystina LaAM-08-1 TaxID=1095629 RepID=A0A0C9X2H6_9AGAR|nr:hypothetical protein K443DRAFT_14966 [Laccaria amethystina LaAM-08-1]
MPLSFQFISVLSNHPEQYQPVITSLSDIVVTTARIPRARKTINCGLVVAVKLVDFDSGSHGRTYPIAPPRRLLARHMCSALSMDYEDECCDTLFTNCAASIPH